ncbi:MAG: adenylate/guanylate cyclase domain-containing protein [Oscillochloridaceae bacterium umkhey_bin13]
MEQRPTLPLSDHAAASLVRYLGSDLATRLQRATPRPQEIYLAASQLGGTYYAITTYLPRCLVARQLATPAPGPWMEWHTGALLFADVSGSTALAEHLTALGREGIEVVTETLNTYFGTMIALIDQADGDLLTFGGDALLVLFEGPQAAHAATSVALAMLRDLGNFVREVPGIGSFPLTLHIGVESGPIALVSAGLPDRLRYTALGHAVNAVARAEGFGGKGELVLGPQAWAAVAADAQGEPLTEGFVRVHQLHRPVPPPPVHPEVLPTLPLSLPELSALAERLDRIAPYLTSELLRRILADPNRSVIEADLRPVTVLFAQVTGLAALIEPLGPDEAAQAVDALLRPLQAIVARLGGFVNKLDLAEEGDKLMAVFGAPVAFEDHAERAARAALLMVTEGYVQIATALAELVGPDNLVQANLRFRIGMNTGNVFAGNVGSQGRKEYTVMGDAVNVAARVMGATAWGHVRCSAATAALVSHTLQCSDPQLVKVKGKAEPLQLFQLVGEREHDAVADLAQGALLGREPERAWLRGHLYGAAEGQGRAVRVMGEAGIGKSRLVAALLAEMPIRVLSARCLEYNQSMPYAPWGEVLRELCGIVAGDDQTSRAQKLTLALEQATIGAEDWLPLLADLVRLEVEPNLIMRALDPSQRQARRFELIYELLQAVAHQAQTHPLVVLIDNLHWADQVSLDLWQYLTARIEALPILLIGLHRGDLAWGSGPQGDHAALIDIGPLHPEASMALIESLATQELDPELRDRLVTRAAGNPLFLEELLRAVELDPDTLDALPDSLSGLLLARIDRLDEQSRSLLRIAAVVGQRFPVGIVQSISGSDFHALVHRLVQLDAEDLTATERESPERIHLFRHALLQEVAYQSLLYVRRRELHRRIGEYLETMHAHDLAEMRAQYRGGLVQIGRNGSLISRAARASSSAIFLLAHHFRLSDKTERAVPYLLLAGHIARDDHANDQAVQQYRWALEIIGTHYQDPQGWEAREALGDVLCILGRYDEAIHEYRTLLTADQATTPPDVQAEVLRSWGDALEKQGNYSEALERLQTAEAICKDHLHRVPPLLLSAIYADMGQVLRRLGRFDEALAVCQTGMAKLRDDRRSSEDERIEADLQQMMGMLYAMRGAYVEARFHFENALAAQEAIDDLYGCSRSHNNLGYLAQLQSDYRRAVRHYGEAETLSRKISAKYVLSSVLLNAAYGYYRLDRYGEAESACHDALALCTEMGDRLGVAQTDDTLGLIAYSRGDYPAAINALQQALVIYREQDSTYQAGNTLAMLALAHCADGALALAQDHANEALNLARSIQVPQLEAEALAALAEIALAMAGPIPEQTVNRTQLLAQAADLAHEAAEVAARLNSKLDQGIALRLAGEIAAQRGDAFAPWFEQALSLLEAAGSAFEAARCQARFGQALAACNEPAAAAYLERAATTFRTIGAQGELRRMGNGGQD